MNIAEYTHNCCGCGECSAVCPTQAIRMQKNDNGFLVPSVDTNKCVQCSLCSEHCVFCKPVFPAVLNQKAFAVKHCNEKIRALSRSGGMFTAISDWILDSDGVVYGCRLENCLEAVHFRAETKQERDAFRGSKYIQSDISSCFEQIKVDLQNGRWVLFSGTACQVNAVRDYCKNIDCTRLVLVDIVCHGVPSQRVWKDYLNYAMKKGKSPIVSVEFRDKKRFGWAAHMETFVFEDGQTYSDELFKELFYGHWIIRDCCFECPFKSLQRLGDITLADCWGIHQNEPEFDDDKGVSLVLVNNERGQMLFDNVCHSLHYMPVRIGDYTQPPLKENWEKPARYEEFWTYYKQYGFTKSCKMFIPKKKKELSLRRLVGKCKRKLKRLLQTVKK